MYPYVINKWLFKVGYWLRKHVSNITYSSIRICFWASLSKCGILDQIKMFSYSLQTRPQSDAFKTALKNLCCRVVLT